ncbi:MAG: DEAD/DEAH box helicase family protein [Nocardioidaceae bacterium]|nr:MAG: DEAD/DEAH box helicase family protein [Nocardioidaceae bacterium]
MGDLQFRFDAELPYQRAAIDAVLTAATATDPPDQLSIEMETGTGKTYVYLRTIADLHKRYGWSRFVIVVPSVAIREGVLSSARQLREHFKQLYDGLVLSLLSYDGARPHRVREFATGGDYRYC